MAMIQSSKNPAPTVIPSFNPPYQGYFPPGGFDIPTPETGTPTPGTPVIPGTPVYTAPTTGYGAGAGCCDTTWLYMIIAALAGGIVGYAIHKTRK